MFGGGGGGGWKCCPIIQYMVGAMLEVEYTFTQTNCTSLHVT